MSRGKHTTKRDSLAWSVGKMNEIGLWNDTLSSNKLELEP
jgi:hypothetical protein